MENERRYDPGVVNAVVKGGTLLSWASAAWENGLDCNVTFMFDATTKPYVGVTVSRGAEVVYSSTCPAENINAMIERVKDMGPEFQKMKKSDEELAAEAYGVSVRELTIGQLEDFKEERSRKHESL